VEHTRSSPYFGTYLAILLLCFLSSNIGSCGIYLTYVSASEMDFTLPTRQRQVRVDMTITRGVCDTHCYSFNQKIFCSCHLFYAPLSLPSLTRLLPAIHDPLSQYHLNSTSAHCKYCIFTVTCLKIIKNQGRELRQDCRRSSYF